MRVIKLEIEVPTKNRGIRIIKQAVALDRRAIQKITDFIRYVKSLCELKGSYRIDIDGFSIAMNETVQILKENRVYQ